MPGMGGMGGMDGGMGGMGGMGTYTPSWTGRDIWHRPYPRQRGHLQESSSGCVLSSWLCLVNLLTPTCLGGDFGGIDFSKLGGAGMPGGDDDEEDSDDDMPPLEGEDEADKAEAAKEAKEDVDTSKQAA